MMAITTRSSINVKAAARSSNPDPRIRGCLETVLGIMSATLSRLLADSTPTRRPALHAIRWEGRAAWWARSSMA